MINTHSGRHTGLDVYKHGATLDQDGRNHAEGLSPFEMAAVEPLPRHPLTPQPTEKQKGITGLLSCSCLCPATASGPQALPGSTQPAGTSAQTVLAGSPSRQQSSDSNYGRLMERLSNRKVKRAGSRAYSDAEWQDALSNFSSSDHAAMLEEAQEVVRELGSFKGPPWVPDPPLVFGTSDMQFIKVPVHTGFAAYWERDEERTTPFPQPIDCMLGASYLVKKTHASIPGIWIRETPRELTITATPSFLPPFLPYKGYEESYDKSNATEPSWIPRRDMKMGRAWGKLYMTADGMLIARVRQRPAFSDEVDVIYEEYMILEQDSNVLVDRMTCLHVPSQKRACQYLVGWRRELPPKGFTKVH